MMAPPHRRQPERETHQAFKQFLDWRLPQRCVFWHNPMGGRRDKVTASLMKSLGAKAGMPDVMILCDGRLYGVELKTPGRKPSEVQRQCHEALRRAGAVIGVADSFDAAVSLLGTWGLL